MFNFLLVHIKQKQINIVKIVRNEKKMAITICFSLYEYLQMLNNLIACFSNLCIIIRLNVLAN